MKYFPLRYRLHAEERCLIWISNEQDSVAVDREGFVPSFRDLIILRRYADQNQYKLEPDKSALHDLDWIVELNTKRITQLACKKVLAAWNLFRACRDPERRAIRSRMVGG